MGAVTGAGVAPTICPACVGGGVTGLTTKGARAPELTGAEGLAGNGAGAAGPPPPPKGPMAPVLHPAIPRPIIKAATVRTVVIPLPLLQRPDSGPKRPGLTVPADTRPSHRPSHRMPDPDRTGR